MNTSEVNMDSSNSNCVSCHDPARLSCDGFSTVTESFLRYHSPVCCLFVLLDGFVFSHATHVNVQPRNVGVFASGSHSAD